MSIELIQKPVIKHDIDAVAKEFKELVDSFEIEKQVANEDTLSHLKEIRATINKKFAELEEQRKFVKKAILTPYQELEVDYKEKLTTVKEEAITKLSDSILRVEEKIKNEKKSNLEKYFSELCEVEKINFIKLENVISDIKLSITEKKYREEIKAFVEQIKSDLSLINLEDYKAEILAEYKTNLSFSQSKITVTDRKTREEAESLRIEEEKKEKESKPVEQQKESNLFTAPKVEEPLKKYQFEIECTATIATELVKFMKTNNIIYKSLKK